jgi:hypothetical protein
MLSYSPTTKLRHFIKGIPGTRGLYFKLRLLFQPSFCEDGLCTVHSADFLNEDKYKETDVLARKIDPDPCLQMPWRIHVLQWAGQQAVKLDGDFVECGVNRGYMSFSVMHYVDFINKKDKKFYLFDTFDGPVQEHLTEDDVAAHWNKYGDVYETVTQTFKDFDNVDIIRGAVPESLESVDIKAVSFLSIDMNCVQPEIAALEHFWPKLVPGGLVVLDDYGWTGHEAQKKAADEFAERHNTGVLSLPTGQGLLMKNP